jgi:hypothetical protein
MDTRRVACSTSVSKVVEMVAIIRDRAEFDKHLERGTSLHDYANTEVSDKAYGAALEIERLIPNKSLP